MPLDLEVDLIIVDYGVNDAVLERLEFDTINVKLAHEVFISHVRNDMIHMPALLYAESFIPATRARSTPQQTRNMAEVHAAVTEKYDIPMVRGGVGPMLRMGGYPHFHHGLWATRTSGSVPHSKMVKKQYLAQRSVTTNSMAVLISRNVRAQNYYM